MEAENGFSGAEGVEPDYLPSLRAASCVTLSFFHIGITPLVLVDGLRRQA